MSARRRWYRRGALASQTAYVAIAFVVITALVSVFAHNFLSYGNLLNTSKNFSYIAIVALGSTLVIITGGIDLSVGSVMALVAVMTAILMKALAATRARRHSLRGDDRSRCSADWRPRRSSASSTAC